MIDLDDVIREADLLETIAELEGEVEALMVARAEYVELDCVGLNHKGRTRRQTEAEL